MIPAVVMLISACFSRSPEVASWMPEPSQKLDSSTTTLTALVTRLSCNSGVTGPVLPPTIERSINQIVITFTVPSSPGGSCQGNDAVSYHVDLGEPIGARSVVDGACLPGQPAAKTAYCAEGPTRFKP